VLVFLFYILLFQLFCCCVGIISVYKRKLGIFAIMMLFNIIGTITIFIIENKGGVL